MNPMVMGPMMANSGGLDFLDDFLGLFDTEWPFLLAIVVCSFSFLGLTISSLILTVSFVPTHWSMKVASGIFLVEPRPSHWLATFGQVRHFLWRASGGELRRRLRRWWRWRKKYAMKTKLNV